MYEEDIFEPNEPNETQEDLAFNAEKQANVAANEKLVTRRKNLGGYIGKIKNEILNAFGGNLTAEHASTALEVLYDWVYAKIEHALNGSANETGQWIRVAHDLISIDEYALMESDLSLVHGMNSSGRDIAERVYNKILNGTSRDYETQAKVFIEIGFALVSIIEEEVNADPELADDYIMIKEDLDKKYSPLFSGLERMYEDMIHTDRRYGTNRRVPARV